jgi:hypothetical protein
MHGRKDPVQSSHVDEERYRSSKYVHELKSAVFGCWRLWDAASKN